MSFKFEQPDAEGEKRMTIASITAVLKAVETQRKVLVEPYDNQISYYKNLLERKKKEAEERAQAAS